MNEVITTGVDLAKNVFQVHGVDADGAVVVRRKLRRRQVLAFFKKLPPCLVGMEACATAHYWARGSARARACRDPVFAHPRSVAVRRPICIMSGASSQRLVL